MSQDSLLVGIYGNPGNQLNSIIYELIDSCRIKYDCSSIPLISLEYIPISRDTSLIRVSPSSGLWLYKAIGNRDMKINGIQVDETIVWINNLTLDSLSLLNGIKFSHFKTIYAKDYNQNLIKDNCLSFKEKDGRTSQIHYNIEYFLFDNDSVAIDNSFEYIERGDIKD